MSAEQVLRAAVIKQMHQFTYRELEFHLADDRRQLLFPSTTTRIPVT